MEFILASIRDSVRLEQVFRRTMPQLVFHAAAYKHVPLMETNPYEAFHNNIVGTRNVLQASTVVGVKRVVLISTDKAVDPLSVMGCSKRIAEMLAAEYGRHAARTSGEEGLSTAVVRFGNVINSTGSVIPTFKQQIQSGGPVTVTHPEMERFFMSTTEAARLVLTAGVLGQHGEVYVLDMGRPIKIVDVARKMLALYGRRDIPIVYTGIRPGEKLREELTAHFETTVATEFRKVRKVIDRAASVDAVLLHGWISAMEGRASGLTEDEIAGHIRRFADGAADHAAWRELRRSAGN